MKYLILLHKTHIFQTYNLYSHRVQCVALRRKGSHRDRYQSRSSIILLDGLGVTLIQAKWVKFLQGYSRLHAMKQNKKHAHGEQQSPQPPHDLVCTGMERRGLRSRTLREGNKTNLNPSVKCSTNDPPCLPSPCFCNFPLWFLIPTFVSSQIFSLPWYLGCWSITRG